MCDCWRCRIDNIGPLAETSQRNEDFREWLTARGTGPVPATRAETGTDERTDDDGKHSPGGRWDAP